MMRRPTTGALTALLLLAPAVVAWKGAALLELQPESRLWITGSSTVRGFTCNVTAFDARIESAAAGAVSAVLGGEKAVTTVDLEVPTGKLDCGNGTMNEHMLKALRAKDNPTISFRLGSYELTKGTDGVLARLDGDLTLGGVTKPIGLTAEVKDSGKGALRVTGSYELKMTGFGLKPPTLMFGTMKVDERVRVGFDLLLRD